MQLNSRIATLSPSATLKFTNKAKALRQQGIDVINLSAGEPDFDTPAHISEAAIASIAQGKTRYTPSTGIPELKQAVADMYMKDMGLKFAPDQVVVTCGVKHALYSVFTGLLDPGDEVILQAPYWVTYPEQVLALGGKPVILDTDESTDFKLTPKQLAAAITPKTKAFLFNSPSNPTGTVYTEAEVRALAEVCRGGNFAIVTDEIYEKLVYGDVNHFSMARCGDDILERCFITSGVSKTYAMTGWRIGWYVGPSKVMPGLRALQDHMTSNMSAPAQYGALAALRGDQSCVREFSAAFDRRRLLALGLLRAIPGMRVAEAKGGFFLFPNVTAFYGRSLAGKTIQSDEDFCEVCLDSVRVSLIPGSPFGAPGHVRLSYATSDNDIETALTRIREMLA